MKRATQAASSGETGLSIPAFGDEPLALRTLEPSPCACACPAGINVKSYVSLIAQGRFAEALEVVRERCPLPGVCGRVCTHPCEAACRRGELDEPVAIRSLKRFVADLEAELPFRPPAVPVFRRAKVAVIGSGPAGLTAAYDLRLAGYAVTVFESEDEPGGMLRHGIAAYRLPPDVLGREIEALLATGIELRTGVGVGSDVSLEELSSEFGAVLLAVGAQTGRRLHLPGEENCPQVQDALAFLREVNGGARPYPGERVIVIGGGSTAVEAARTARRLGAKSVEIVYRRSRPEMPADEEELAGAEAEGVRLRLLVAPVRVLSAHGRLFALECRHMQLGEPDESGRRRPVAVEGSEFLIEVDLLLAAVGQEVDLGFVPTRLSSEVEQNGRLLVEAESGATRLSGVFAAGDVAGGPATVVHAIGSGHLAARSIRRYLEPESRVEGEDDAAQHAPELELAGFVPPSAPRRRPEHDHGLSDPSFPEVEHAFDRELALAEALRCLRCGPCSECSSCVPSCQHRHAEMQSLADDGEPRSTRVRIPWTLAEELDPGHPVPASLLSVDAATDTPVELFAPRNRIREELCRGCLSCAEVCSFDAIHLRPAADGRLSAHIDPLECRGCTLCSAVCPTHASVPRTPLPQPWQAWTVGEEPCVVLTCLNEVPRWTGTSRVNGRGLELIGLPCVGQVDEGTLLELHRHGAALVAVSGCSHGHCRFGAGASLAAASVRRTRALLRLLGGDVERVVELPRGASVEELGRLIPDGSRAPLASTVTPRASEESHASRR